MSGSGLIGMRDKMGHPLTSKERRGLAAVAAAALLCVGMGFGFRSCSTGGRDGLKSEEVRVEGEDGASRARDKGEESRVKGQGKKRGKRAKKEKAEKVIPVRDPLSQPCD